MREQQRLVQGLRAWAYARGVRRSQAAFGSVLFLLVAPGVVAGHLRVGAFITRRDDESDVFNTCAQCFLHQDAEHRFLRAIPVDEILKRESALIPTSSGDDRLSDVHPATSESI